MTRPKGSCKVLSSHCVQRGLVRYDLNLTLGCHRFYYLAPLLVLDPIYLTFQNFKEIARLELKCVQYSEGDYILCMTSRYFFHSFTNVRLLCFVSHSNGMTSCQCSSAENVSCNVAPFFYHHSVVIQYLVSVTLYQTGNFR